MKAQTRLTDHEARSRQLHPTTDAWGWVAIAVIALLLATVGCGGDGGGGGGGGAAGATFAFAGNQDGTISAFEVDTDGELTNRNYTVVSNHSVTAVASILSGRFVAVLAGNTIYSCEVDGQTGALQVVSSLPTGSSATALAVNEMDRTLYVSVAGGTSSIVAYRYDAGTGALSSVGSTPLASTPTGLRIHPRSTHLYVTTQSAALIVVTLDHDGSLDTHGTYPMSDQVREVQLSSDGMFAYASVENTLEAFRVDTSSGALTLIDSHTVSSNANLGSVLLNADDSIVYVVNLDNARVYAYALHPTNGTIDSSDSSSASPDGSPSSLTLLADESALLVGDGSSNTVATLTLTDVGHIVAVVDQTASRSSVRALALRKGSGATSSTPRLLYVPHSGNGEIQSYFAHNGTLSPRWTTPTGTRPRQVVFHPNGERAYAINSGSHEIETFKVAPGSGQLTSFDVLTIPVADAEQDFIRLAVDPTGRFLYALDGRINLGVPGRVRLFPIEADGAVGASTSVTSTGDNPENLLIAPNGRFLYVMNSWGDSITVFEINRTSGTLSQKQYLTGYDRPLVATMHPNGRWLYVTVENDQAVVRFRVQTNGNLSNPIEYQKPSSPSDTLHVTIHPNRNDLYVTDWNGSLVQWRIHPTTGALSYFNELTSVDSHWLEISADGRNAYGLAQNGLERFSVDPDSGVITIIGRTDVTGLGTYQRSITLR